MYCLLVWVALDQSWSPAAVYMQSGLGSRRDCPALLDFFSNHQSHFDRAGAVNKKIGSLQSVPHSSPYEGTANNRD